MLTKSQIAFFHKPALELNASDKLTDIQDSQSLAMHFNTRYPQYSLKSSMWPHRLVA
jgi:hypothetical protein